MTPPPQHAEHLLRARGEFSVRYPTTDAHEQPIIRPICIPRSYGDKEQSKIVSQHHNALASLLQDIAHPHVHSTPFLFHDLSTDCLALTMPYFPNGNIIEYLLTLGEAGFDINPTRRLLIAETSDGLSFLHEHGIIHGNIRGSNILVTNAGHALLVDTGINTAVVETYEYTPLPVNAAWMAPELFVWDEAEEVEAGATNIRTPQSDVYSLGRTIEEVYTLRAPFSRVAARNRMHFIIKLRTLLLAPPVQPVGMPQDIWSVMKSCLAVIPADRPSARSLPQLLSS